MPLRRLPSLAVALSALALAVLATASPASARERYSVTFASGERLETDTLPSWPVPEKSFQVAGRALFDAKNPAALVRDQKAESLLSSPALLMANGDLLNAVPQRLAPTEGRSGEPAWLQVQLEARLVPVDGTSLLVRADRVRRILAGGRALSPEPPPGTVVFIDGRQLTARSIRWREYGLALLTENGIVEAHFAELADVVLPGVDVVQGLLEDNLWAGREGQAILRFTLAGGGVLTTSQATRIEERSRSRAGRRVDVFYYVQPSWAKAALAVPEEEIAWCGYRATDEALLPLMPAETLARRRLVGQPSEWQSTGGPHEAVPAGGGRESDLAVATHAHSEIAFTLPPAAKSLSLSVGIAQHVRPGGCVVGKIFAEEPGGELLWESGFLTGADAAKETGDLDVAGFKRVVLVTEFGHDGRPGGADPLDIRDEVRWLRPIVKLDLAQLRTWRAIAPLLPGLETWRTEDGVAEVGVPGAKRSGAPAIGELNPNNEPSPSSAANPWSQVSLETVWSDVHDRWEPVLVLPRGQELQLTRTISIDRSNDVLELAAACPPSSDAHDFEVSVDGQPLAPTVSREAKDLRKALESILPRLRRRERETDRERSFDDTLAYWWDLQAFRGQQVTLTLLLRAKDGESRIAWRGLALRSAIGNLPEGGTLPTVDVRLDTLDPHDLSSHKDRGSPAKNALPGRRGEPIRYLGQPATGGYGMVRNSHVTFDLKPEYRRFVAVVGAVAASSGPFEVLVDDQVVWHKDAVDNLAPAELLQIDLPKGAKQITIVNGNDGSYGGHAGWTDAGFVTKP